MTFLDTNYLVGVVTSGTTQDQQSGIWIGSNEEICISMIAWAEFLCGPVYGAA
jgi:predicted nucleic acid-binding protein